jgi:hypothetical protein
MGSLPSITCRRPKGEHRAIGLQGACLVSRRGVHRSTASHACVPDRGPGERFLVVESEAPERTARRN